MQKSLNQASKKRFIGGRRHYLMGILLLVGVCFICLTVVTYLVVGQLARRVDLAAQSRFEIFSAQISGKINNEMIRYVDVLPSLRGLWKVVGGMPTRAQFEGFAASLNADGRFPSLVSINYADLIATDDTEAYQSHVRDVDHLPSFTVYPLRTRNDHRLVVRYGPETLSALFGRDILTNFLPGTPIYKHTLEETEPYMSGIGVPLRPGHKGDGLGVRLAVYRGNVIPPPSARASETLGSVGIFINLLGLVKTTVSKDEWRNIYIHMVSLANPDDIPGGNRNLVDEGADVSGMGTVFAHTSDVYVAGRHFLLTIRAPLRYFLDPLGAHIRGIGYGVGLLLSSAISVIVFLLLSSRVRLLQTVTEQSSSLDSNRAKLAQLLSEQLLAEQEIARQGEQERQRIGKELHDDLGQRLTGASLMLNTLSKVSSDAAKQNTEVIDRVAAIVEGSIHTIRALSRGLSPFDDSHKDLSAALRELGGELDGLLSEGCLLNIAYDTELLTDLERLHLYRIVQESAVNAIRHGNATCLTISLWDNEGRPNLSIADNGDGIRSDVLEGEYLGLGLRSIRSRAHSLGLDLYVKNVTTGGTSIEVR